MVKELSTDTVHCREHDKPDDSNATFLDHKLQTRTNPPPGNEGPLILATLTVRRSPSDADRHSIFAHFMKRQHRQPQRENTAELTKPVRPLKVRRRTLAVPSRDAVSTYWPSAEKTAEMTEPVWPFKVRKHSPEAADHTFAVRSKMRSAIAGRRPRRLQNRPSGCDRSR